MSSDDQFDTIVFTDQISDQPDDANPPIPPPRGGVASMQAFWLGGAFKPITAGIPGVASMQAFWLGGAVSPSGPPIPGVVSMQAFWMGGAVSAAGTTTPPPGGDFQFLIAGPDITEQFVTHGSISAMNLSYTLNPLSRRTV